MLIEPAPAGTVKCTSSPTVWRPSDCTCAAGSELRASGLTQAAGAAAGPTGPPARITGLLAPQSRSDAAVPRQTPEVQA